KLRWLLAGVLCQVATLSALAVAGPSISISQNTPTTTDDSSVGLFSGSSIDHGATNLITVTVDFNATSLGTLAPLPPGVTQTGTNYVFGPDTDTNLTAILNQFTFTPVANFIPVGAASNVVFHVRAVDANANSAIPHTVTLTITPVNDSPVLTLTGAKVINDKTNAVPFTSVAASDPDNQGKQTNIVTLTLASTNGYLLVGSSGFVSNNLAYTYRGPANTVATALGGLIYQPVENALPPGQYGTNFLTVVDTDGALAVTNTSVQIAVLSVNDAPTLVGVATNATAIATGHTLAPGLYQTAYLHDVDQNDDLNNKNGQTLAWTVTLSGPAPLGQLTLNGNPIGTTYSSSNDSATASSLLSTINYLPPVPPIAGTNELSVVLTANDFHGGVLSYTNLLELYSIVVQPGLNGIQSGSVVSDNSLIAPFSSVTVQGHNGNAVTVVVQLMAQGGITNDSAGTFINLGSFSQNNAVQPSQFQMSGSSEAVTAGLEALLFQPTANLFPADQLARFQLTLIDGVLTNSNTNTTIIIRPVNDAPAIYGVASQMTITDNQTVHPFSTVSVVDADTQGSQTNICNITLDNLAKGAFDAASLGGFTFNGSVYSMTNSPGQITAAIRQLNFKPTANRLSLGQTETTTFTISLNDQHNGLVNNANTQVRVVGQNGNPVISLPPNEPVSYANSGSITALSGVSILDPTLLQVS
ncbi:MAG TPA: hypothetical protein VF607_08075, partial [Verrucomicrobiae bacterium]